MPSPPLLPQPTLLDAPLNDSRSKHQNRLALLILLLLNGIWCITLRFSYFDMDDQLYIWKNIAVRNGISWSTIEWAFTNTISGFWLPLTWLSLALDTTIYGPTPWGYHLTNILIHTVNTLLVYQLLRTLFGSTWKSLFAAVLFAVHPQRVESVAWATERKDVLAALFGLLALFAYIRYARSPNYARYALLCILFLCSLMAKPMLVTLPLLLLILDYCPLRRLTRFDKKKFWLLFREKIPLFCIAAAISFNTLVLQFTEGSTNVALPARLANMVLSYFLYVRDFFSSHYLMVAYMPRLLIPSWMILCVLSAFIIINAFIIRRLLQSSPYAPPLLAGWLWFLITLIPMSGIVQSGSIIRADRFMYFPVIGLLIMLIWGVAPALALYRLPRSALALGACAIVSLSLLATWHRLLLWQDPLQLYENDLARDDNNFYLQMIAGFAAKDRRLNQRALAHFKRAAELEPLFVSTYTLELSLLQTTTRADPTPLPTDTTLPSINK